MRPVFNKTKRLLDVITFINGYNQNNRLILTDFNTQNLEILLHLKIFREGDQKNIHICSNHAFS